MVKVVEHLLEAPKFKPYYSRKEKKIQVKHFR
jgi:hypothetical protein